MQGTRCFNWSSSQVSWRDQQSSRLIFAYNYGWQLVQIVVDIIYTHSTLCAPVRRHALFILSCSVAHAGCIVCRSNAHLRIGLGRQTMSSVPCHCATSGGGKPSHWPAPSMYDFDQYLPTRRLALALLMFLRLMDSVRLLLLDAPARSVCCARHPFGCGRR